ncbi:MAG: type II secretion system protein GspL, partial [Pseudomonadota bacterium]
MTQTLAILLGPGAAGGHGEGDRPLRWALRDDETGVIVGEGPVAPPMTPDAEPEASPGESAARLADLAAMGAERTLAIVPGAHVALKVVELPAKTDAQARAAAPFLLEDDVAEDIDQSHLALGPAHAPRGGEDGGTARAVAIVSRTRLAAWRAPFDAAELRLTHMTPDYLAVAPERRNGALWDLGDRLVAAFVDDAGERSGFALEPELATTLIG